MRIPVVANNPNRVSYISGRIVSDGFNRAAACNNALISSGVIDVRDPPLEQVAPQGFCGRNLMAQVLGC
ncbi:hypothetical protein ACOJBO_04140 [Rhizobium beringeri]